MERLVDTPCRDAKVSIWSNRRKDTQLSRLGNVDRMELKSNKCTIEKKKKIHIPSNLVVERITAHRKPPEVRIWRLSNQSRVGNRPPSTSTPHCPACLARR
jgi:hypothetical protein